MHGATAEMRLKSTILAVAFCAFGALPVAAQHKGEDKPPVFDKKFLSTAANIELGKTVWDQQCRHCHGAAAYPGKAPKLSPGSLDPDFIYDRVTNGFGKMPAWKDVFSMKERMAVTAYIKSEDFSP
jgi:mono/diheme cytochrome c family protein